MVDFSVEAFDLSQGRAPAERSIKIFYCTEPDRMNRSRKYLWLSAVVLVISAGVAAGAWTLFLRPIKVAGRGRSSATCRFRSSGSERSRRVSHPRSGSRCPACSSICARMSGIACPRARCWPASTTASRARASAGPRPPIEQAEAKLQRATASVEKAQANYANAKNINERRQKLVQSKTASVETARDLEGGRRTPRSRK